MAHSSVEQILSDRFQLPHAPTIEARITSSGPGIALSRIRNDKPKLGHSIIPPEEEAFVFKLPLVAATYPDLQYGNRKLVASGIRRPGQVFLLDMTERPVIGLHNKFDHFRIYVSAQTLDELSYEQGGRHVGGLLQQEFGSCDPIMFHLAKSVLPALEAQHPVAQAFIDHVALACCAHIMNRYANLCVGRRHRHRGLAAWQMLRIRSFVEADLSANPAIADLALQCGLSTSYFFDAFKKTNGISPHQWILNVRIERAKALLMKGEKNISEISLECGFFDQSHLARVFLRREKCNPGEWRRRMRIR
ncbi:helix-turn-helix transcriptional regulator [Gluconacetobacter sp. 1c LMG 22058]|uniref:Helix-turn-helix transcriptional regulator n=1 Tax=Gluconacetobacter dulcium TaxID=2729096 RepID=A0A7W4K1L4_9PROT|nr:AraC family transcriptional regulator [Gluconacetobacter dulcium]MBB2198719.1 helix-turn-helix transcriptional regulator [Gluconacetobacter dulcium]